MLVRVPHVRAGLMPSSSPFSSSASKGTAMAAAAALEQHASAASSLIQPSINFFGGVRVPAMLIAGSSVAALFSLVGPAAQTKATSRYNRVEWIVLRLYHTMALLSFLLSMTTVVTTTTANTSLLLHSPQSFAASATTYPDVYHFLRGPLNLEFVLTRWSFFTSVLLFILGATSRLLLELQLLQPGRHWAACTVGWTVVTFLSTILSRINCTLNCWPHLGAMTLDLCHILWQRATTRDCGSPLQLVSSFSFGAALVCALYSLGTLLLDCFGKSEGGGDPAGAAATRTASHGKNKQP